MLVVRAQLGQEAGGVEVKGGQGLVEMGRCPAADKDGRNAGLVQGPGECEVRLAIASALGDALKPRQALVREGMKVNFLVARYEVKP